MAVRQGHHLPPTLDAVKHAESSFQFASGYSCKTPTLGRKGDKAQSLKADRRSSQSFSRRQSGPSLRLNPDFEVRNVQCEMLEMVSVSQCFSFSFVCFFSSSQIS